MKIIAAIIIIFAIVVIAFSLGMFVGVANIIAKFLNALMNR
jgi:hypothetical protein